MRIVLRLALVAATLAFAAGCASSNSDRRNDWRRPDAVIALLGIDPGDRVVDYGARDGAFASRFAEAVGETGRVLPVGPEGEIDAPSRELDGSVDLYFVYDAYHRIPDRVASLRQVLDVLVPNGRVAIVEPRDSVPAERIVREMGEAGYELVARHDLLPRQSFQIFRPDDGTGE